MSSIEWKEDNEAHVADVGLMTVGVTDLTGRWAVTIHDNDIGIEMHNESFVGTLEEAQRLAVKRAQELVAPLVADAVAAERAECAAIVDQFMIELCGITGDIFSVQYHAKDLARRAVKLAADRIRARGQQRAPIAHAHRCSCGKSATHEQCGGLLVCEEHIGPGRAWPIDAKTIEWKRRELEELYKSAARMF